MSEREFRSGEVIYREGDYGDVYYLVLAGAVRIVINAGMPNELVLNTMVPGQYFGEISGLGGYARSATAVAAEEGTRLLELGSSDMNTAFRDDPELVMDLLRYLGSQLRKLSGDYEEALGRLEELKTADAQPRNASFMNKVRRFASLHLNRSKAREKPSVESWQVRNGYTARPVTSYPAGTVLYREGEPGTCMYCVHFGSVGIYAGYGTDHPRKLTEVMVNQFFGEMGLLCDDPRSATAVIMENDTTLEAIYPKDMDDLFQNNPAKVWMILEYIGLRLRQLTDDYVEVCHEICAREEPSA